jgi:hypothetical protein
VLGAAGDEAAVAGLELAAPVLPELVPPPAGEDGLWPEEPPEQAALASAQDSSRPVAANARLERRARRSPRTARTGAERVVMRELLTCSRRAVVGGAALADRNTACRALRAAADGGGSRGSAATSLTGKST